MKAHWKTCSYCTAALFQEQSLLIPLFINPSQDDLCSLYVTIAILSACKTFTARISKSMRVENQKLATQNGSSLEDFAVVDSLDRNSAIWPVNSKQERSSQRVHEDIVNDNGKT